MKGGDHFVGPPLVKNSYAIAPVICDRNALSKARLFSGDFAYLAPTTFAARSNDMYWLSLFAAACGKGASTA
jgi:hypothetical protein